MAQTSPYCQPHTTSQYCRKARVMELRRYARRRLIDVARRRQRPGAGSSDSFLQRRTAVVEFPDLRPVLTTLRWAVIGDVATRLYMPERATRNLDIAVRREDGEQVRAALTASGFQYQSDLSVGGSSWTSPDGAKLDVVEMEATWLSHALKEAQLNRDAQGLPVLPLAYLVLIRFESGRV